MTTLMRTTRITFRFRRSLPRSAPFLCLMVAALLGAGGWAACSDASRQRADAPATQAPPAGAAREGTAPAAASSPAETLPAVRVLLGDVAPEPASWSPDGTEIVVDDQDLFGLRIVPSAGGAARALTEEPLHNEPEWSPSGGMIAFVDKAGGSLSVIPARGGPVKALARGTIEGYQAPWSPDGGQLLFQKDGGLALADVTSGRTMVLVAATGDGPPLVAARWSPGGKQIVAQRRREILIVPASGGPAQVVAGLSGQAPALGPDGTLWVIGDGPGRPLVRRAGETTQEVSGLGGAVSSFDIDPGSGRIAVAVKGRGILVLPAGGGAPWRLTDGTGDHSPRWSPGGGAVAFVRAGGQHGLQLCVVDVRRDLQ